MGVTQRLRAARGGGDSLHSTCSLQPSLPQTFPVQSKGSKAWAGSPQQALLLTEPSIPSFPATSPPPPSLLLPMLARVRG